MKAIVKTIVAATIAVSAVGVSAQTANPGGSAKAKKLISCSAMWFAVAKFAQPTEAQMFRQFSDMARDQALATGISLSEVNQIVQAKVISMTGGAKTHLQMVSNFADVAGKETESCAKLVLN